MLKSRLPLLWLGVLLAIAVVITPAWIIQPFKPQTASGVAISYAFKRISPWLTLLLSAGAIYLLVTSWRAARGWWRRPLLVLGTLFIFGFTWLARQNHFEWMFNPLPHPGYVRGEQASFVDPKDLVMTVANGSEAVAYPIRQMAYHHVVQDDVGGVPLVVTY